MKTNTRLYSVLTCTVHVSVCRRFGVSTFWCVDVLVSRHFLGCFGLSMFWSVDGLVCRCFGMSTFWYLNDLVCRRFDLSTFRCVDISVDVLDVNVSVCRHFDQSPTKGSTLTYQSLVANMVIILQMTYPNGFLQWHYYNLALHEFYFLNIIYILLYIDLILSILFQYSNILTRASHHWCLASNIVLVLFDFTIAVWMQCHVGMLQ